MSVRYKNLGAANSPAERRSEQLLPRSFTSSSCLIVGIPLFSNASEELIPVLSVQSLVPWIIISSSSPEFAPFLSCALSIASGLWSGRSHGITVLGACGWNTMSWYSSLTKRCSLADCQCLIRICISRRVNQTELCKKHAEQRYNNYDFHVDRNDGFLLVFKPFVLYYIWRSKPKQSTFVDR